MSGQKTTNEKQEVTNPISESKDLFRLATIIIIGSFAIIGIIIFLFYYSAGNQSMQTMLTATLPLIGAWVGAVIAFYFSSKNLESATKSVQNLVVGLSGQQKLKTIPAKEKMIPKSEIHYAQGDDDTKLVLTDMLVSLEKTGKGDRVPVLSSKEIPRYVIHRSVIDKFVAKSAVKTAADPSKAENLQTLSTQLSGLTLNDLIAGQPELKHSFGVVSEESTLADVKALMDALGKQCQDVFVTKKGSYTEPIVGWVTNAIIEENSKV
jgi:hypothetical protein